MTVNTVTPAEEPTKVVVPVVSHTEWPHTRTVIRTLVIVVAMAGILWMLHALKGVLLLVVLAVFFAYLVSPLVRLVQRSFWIGGRERKMPRAAAIGVVYLAIFGSLGTVLFLLLPLLGEQVTQFAKQAPAYLVTTRGRAQKLNDLYQHYQLPPALRDSINDTLTRGIGTAGEYFTAQMSTVVGWIAYLPWLVLIPILGFFLLKDAEGFRHSALLILPKGRLRWRGDEFFEDVNNTLAAYIRAQLMACLIIGFICALGFYLLGVPYPLALGVIAGLLEFVPLVGPITAGVLAATVSSFHSFDQTLWVLVFLLVLRIIEDYVIYPRLIGHGIHLHPFAIILAVLCGAELAGIAGIFLAIPVVAIASVGYRHSLEHRGSDGLMGEMLGHRVEVTPTAPDNASLKSAK